VERQLPLQIKGNVPHVIRNLEKLICPHCLSSYCPKASELIVQRDDNWRKIPITLIEESVSEIA